MTAVEAVWLGVGLLVFVAGFTALSVARRLDDRRVAWPVIGRVSRATETAAGIALVVSGYHIAAYGGPAGWIVFRVPPSLGWLVFVASSVAVVGSAATDRILTGDVADVGED